MSLSFGSSPFFCIPLARIREKNGFYDSAVFAIYDHKTYAEVLVFDKGERNLKRVPFTSIIDHGIRIDVFIFDTKAENWVKTGKNEGYDWLLGRTIDAEIIRRCAEIQANIHVPEWFELRNKDDVNGLISATTGLHDAYVKKIYKRGEKLYLHFAAWSCEVLFELMGSPETNLFEGYGHMSIGDEYPLIDEASVFFEDGKVCWTDYENAHSFADRDKYKCAYFLAETIRWKFNLTESG